MSIVEEEAVSETRNRLIARREDIYASIRALECDHADGLVDPVAYRSARERYEGEAAEVLERLDRLANVPEPAASSMRRERRAPIALAAAMLFVVAIAIFLVAALRVRGSSDPVTGSAPPQPATPVPAQIVAAEQRVRKHPRSMTAYVALGNAYLGANNSSKADAAFLIGMRLDPGSPEPTTMHALVLGTAQNRITPALVLLASVEHAHPSFAHAWLVDGLLSSRRAPGFPRAIAAYRRFLQLAPHSEVASDVRVLLVGLERAQEGKR